ncbi:MAG: TetR/AcrR family transcriptional regulator [Duncaniella sp.]|nr:TetR/AcrR family transcriptional regulator [Duncaniella sp.]
MENTESIEKTEYSETEKVHDTEQIILAAAEKEFMEKGFAGARTTAIAEAAGVSTAMLHYYFRTKEKLFERILSDKMEAMKGIFAITYETTGSKVSTIIRDIINNHLDFLAANPDLPRFLIGEIYSNSPAARMFLEKIKTYSITASCVLNNRIACDCSRTYRKVDTDMLLLDIVSLNVFSFLAAPVVKAAFGHLVSDMDRFIAMRKKENYDTIMRKLTPDDIL